MGKRNFSFMQGEHYHIYNRGNSKQIIFRSESDYKRFLSLLYLSNTTMHFNFRDILKGANNVFEIERPDLLVKIGAYCLMPNHFHLLLSPIQEDGLAKFMQKLSTAYSMYFNTKYERTGGLFEGKYKARFAYSDEYLKYLFSYIHLNPVTSKNDLGEIVRRNPEKSFQKAKNYPHGSLQEYLGPKTNLGVIDTSMYKIFFDTPDSVKRELFEWLQYEEPALGLA